MLDNAALPATIDHLFGRESRWQSWLDVEAALAEAQAELGMIPAAAAKTIADRASLDHFDLEALAADMKRTLAPVLSLVHFLADACGAEAGGFVHWGGTTQNITQTGRTLVMRRAHDLIMARYANCLDVLARMAEDSAEYLTAGRTNRRHALPITFGFKVAGWIEELVRQEERFRQAESRVFKMVFGGTIGAMHVFGDAGPAVVEGLARRLGLTNVLVPLRTTIDPLTEYILNLSMFAMACSRIGQELFVLMGDEFEEVSEDLGDAVFGSSTMPHKNNPKHVVWLIANAARLRAMAAPALEAGQASHEGDSSCNHLINRLINESCPLAYDLAGKLELTLQTIRLHPERMAANLTRSADVIATERLMMVMADVIGRQKAHEQVHDAVTQARRAGRPLVDLLLADPVVADNFERRQLEAALDPASYVGLSPAIARQAAALARDTAAAVRGRVGGTAAG